MGPGQELHPLDEVGVSGNGSVDVPVGAHQIGQDLGVAWI